MTTEASANPPAPDDAGRTGPSHQIPRRGDPGVWSWVLHRITGVAIFLIIFVHVLDTALVRISPQAYDEVVDIYKTPVVAVLELALVAAVLFHTLNGVRVVVVDFWLKGARYQRVLRWTVGIAWLLLMVPAAVVMALNLFGRSG